MGGRKCADVICMAVVCSALVILAGGVGPAGEKAAEDAGAAGEKQKQQEDKKGEAARIKEIPVKKHRGEELPPEEKKLIEEHAVRAEKFEKKGIKDRREKKADGAADAGNEQERMPPDGTPPLPLELNALDSTRIELACILAEKGRMEEAVAVLKDIAQKSPDPAGRSAAAFRLSEILGRRGDADGARANLRLVVSGPLAEEARRRIVGPLVRDGRFAEAMSELLHFIRNAGTPLDKVRTLRHYAEVAKLSDNADLVAKTIEEIPRLISFEEAAKAVEMEEKEQALHRARIPGALFFDPPWAAPDRERPEDIRDRVLEAMPEELREKARETKGLPPGERRKVLREAWEVAIREAEKAGDEERVKRLREAIERVEKFRENKPPGKALKGERRPDLDKLRAEIRELEDMGRFEDAKRLRRQMEAADAARLPGEAKDDF